LHDGTPAISAPPRVAPVVNRAGGGDGQIWPSAGDASAVGAATTDATTDDEGGGPNVVCGGIGCVEDDDGWHRRRGGGDRHQFHPPRHRRTPPDEDTTRRSVRFGIDNGGNDDADDANGRGGIGDDEGARRRDHRDQDQ